jgi:hypothetical protein
MPHNTEFVPRPASSPHSPRSCLPLRRLHASPLRWPALRLVVLVAMLVLTGCQRTLFSQPPAAEARCEAALQGRWVSVTERGEPDGEIAATVDADCRLSVVESRPEGPRAWPPVTVASGRVAGRELVWLDAPAINRAFEISPGPLDRDGAVYVFAYTLKRDRLDLLPPAHRRLARRVVDGKLDGAVLVDGSDITVRVDGDADALASLWRDRRSFQRTEPLRFRRAQQGVDSER